MQDTFRADGREIRIDRHEPGGDGKRPAILLLHGSGGNIGFWLDRLAPVLSSAGVALFAPHYFDRTGTQRADFAAITDGVHVPQWLETIDAALAFAAAQPRVDPARVALVGISLGAYLSLALAAEFSASSEAAVRKRIRCIVELSGGLAEPFASMATREFPPTLVLHGEADTVVPVSEARALDARLEALGVAHETRVLRGEGHWFSGGAQFQLMLTVAGFLKQRL